MAVNKIIQTERILLRKYTDDDKETVADFFTDAEIGRYMGDGPSETRNDAYTLFNKIIEIYGRENAQRHFEIWGIEFEGELIGHLELKSTENTLKDELEVVYLLDKVYWGKGIMGEILTALNSHAKTFQKKIIATVKEQNYNSIRVLEKIGIDKMIRMKDEINVLKITLKQA